MMWAQNTLAPTAKGEKIALLHTLSLVLPLVGPYVQFFQQAPPNDALFVLSIDVGNENLRIQPNGLFELLISLNPLAIKGGEGTTERKCALTKCTNFPVSQMMNDGYRYKAKKNTFIRCRSIRQSVGPSIRPSHFWIAGSFCITAPAQSSATLLPCIRPCLFISNNTFFTLWSFYQEFLVDLSVAMFTENSSSEKCRHNQLKDVCSTFDTEFGNIGTYMVKPLGIQKCDRPTDVPTNTAKYAPCP